MQSRLGRLSKSRLSGFTNGAHVSTYKNDLCTDIILDFIAGGVPGNPSGESGGNYNAVIGDAHATADLGAMTLDGIYGLMATLVAAGKPSSATGRYQIIHDTLKGLQASQKLTNDTLFTPELQDKLAVALMVGRGYSKWWTGAMTDADFAHGLSMEWASLPDPQNGGKSHYDGDSAGNHASTTLPHVYEILQRARAAQPVPQPGVPMPDTPTPPTPTPIPAPPPVPTTPPGMVTVTMPKAIAALVAQVMTGMLPDIQKTIADLGGKAP